MHPDGCRLSWTLQQDFPSSVPLGAESATFSVDDSSQIQGPEQEATGTENRFPEKAPKKLKARKKRAYRKSQAAKLKAAEARVASLADENAKLLQHMEDMVAASCTEAEKEATKAANAEAIAVHKAAGLKRAEANLKEAEDNLSTALYVVQIAKEEAAVAARFANEAAVKAANAVTERTLRGKAYREAAAWALEAPKLQTYVNDMN